MVTIPDAPRRTEYAPTSATTGFPVGFIIFDNDDLYVTLNGVERTDYSVSATYVYGTASDAVVNAIAPGWVGAVVVEGRRAPRREDQFQDGRGVSARDLNLILNRVVAESRENFDRSIGLRTLLDERISAEAQQRYADDQSIYANINAEISARKTGDGALGARIDALSPGSAQGGLTAPRTYYVRKDGNDANDGLSNSGAGAFATLARAVRASRTLAANGYAVSIQVGPGTFTEGLSFEGPLTGGGTIAIIGDTTTPGNCIISTTSAHCLFATDGARVRIQGFRLQTATAGCCLYAASSAEIEYGAIEFGTCAAFHKQAADHGRIRNVDSYKITGSAVGHEHAYNLAYILNINATVTIAGTPAFSAFFVGNAMAYVQYVNVTFSGAATGRRFLVHENGIINSGTENWSYLPGSTTGLEASGGRYWGTYDAATRRELIANEVLYVAPAGDDANNDGRSAATPFKTLQRAIDVVATYDLRGFMVTIQLADGTYTDRAALRTLTDGAVMIRGNTAALNAVTINVASGDAISAAGVSGNWLIDGVQISAAAGNAISARDGSTIQVGAVSFAACGGAHMRASSGGLIRVYGNYRLVGGAAAHVQADGPGSQVVTSGRTLTLLNGPTFSTAFALASYLGGIDATGMTFAGSVGGSRYSATLNAVINTNGGGASYLPGNAAGSVATGGVYN